MPKLSERVRLKDRIVEKISKAVKQIQRLHDDKGEEVVLGNGDWQFHKLVGHLDHALMHGLKHITNGYWVVVQEFTPKATIKEIGLMQNVTTNLGRGRAWLYIALTDRLLESYIKCYMDNRGRVSKFYLKEAVMLDQQSIDVIHTLAAGLEFITFNLEVDVPYLDLASYQPARTNSCEEECDNETDSFSLASSNSTMSLNTTQEIAEVAVDAASLQSDFGSVDSKQSFHTSKSTPVFQEHLPITNLHARNSLDVSIETKGDLEVIRHKIKVHHRGKRRKRKGDNDSLSSVDIDRVSISSRTNQDSPVSLSSNPSHESPLCVPVNNQDSPLTPESGYRSVVDNGSPKGRLFDENGIVNGGVYSPIIENEDGSSPVQNAHGNSELLESELEGLNQNGTLTNIGQNNCDLGTLKNCSDLSKTDVDHSKSSQGSRNAHLIHKLHKKVDNVESTKSSHGSDNPHLGNLKQDNCDGNQTNDINPNDSNQINAMRKNHVNSSSDEGLSTSYTDDLTIMSPVKSVDGGTFNCKNNSEEKKDLLMHKSVEIGPIYDVLSTCIDNNKSTKSIGKGRSETAKKTENIPSSDLLPKLNTKCDSTKTILHKNNKSEFDWDVNIDNNTKLYLMLEVFLSEEEMFIKMFKTCLGHTEGEIVPVHVMITDCAIYIITPGLHNCRFRREAGVTFKELDYISLSLGYQVINIVCTNRRKQFWITTGDEALTKSIVFHLDNAISHSLHDIPRLSVLTDATIQKIAIKKWASTECTSQKTELKILDYSLVYWEDAETNSSSWLQVNANKAGKLHYKSHNAYFGFGAPVWKDAYFVLKDGALFMYNEQHDSMDNTPAISCLQLNHEECQGCRTCRDTDRPHSLEIMLKNGSSLQLSADDLTECQEWLQSLCQVVAQGMGALPKSDGSLACCSVLTSTRLLLCHEDVQTNFFRTLAAANVMDISAVQVDRTVNTYCFLKFDSPNHAEHQKWVLYFNSQSGRDSFLTALDQAWSKLFQVSLVVGDIVDLTLQQHCRENVNTIKQQRTI